MYGILTNMCPKNHPNVGKYTSIMDPMGLFVLDHGTQFGPQLSPPHPNFYAQKRSG